MEIAVLRRGFKAVCKATEDHHQNFQVRVHRSLSWLERALEMDEEAQPEGRLLYAWIGLSALYSSRDSEAGFAARDGES